MIALDVPQGVSVEVKENTVTAKGALGTNVRKLNDKFVAVAFAENKIQITAAKEKKLLDRAGRVEKAAAKEIEMDMQGVLKPFEIRMKMVFAHFPANVEVKGSDIKINNLIGERVPRIAKIQGKNTKIEAKGQDLKVTGTSLEDVSQTAANIRKACRIRRKDSRVFQDGLYYAIE